MELYFSPLACSMATRVALYEAGESASFLEVDPKTKRVLASDTDFLAVNPLGLVPTLRTEDGDILTENAAILQYVANRFPGANITASNDRERARLHQWLCFIGTELHKGLFGALLDRKAPPEVHAYALKKGLSRLDYLNACLEGREFLLERFTVADAYLVTVLNWSVATPQIDVAKWPNVKEYLSRLRKRPSVSRALAEEMVLYQAEVARHKAA
ncbi:MAG: glutathione S-transferase N-terminal domain-containing protein [Pseudomonadota bacterium]